MHTSLVCFMLQKTKFASCGAACVQANGANGVAAEDEHEQEEHSEEVRGSGDQHVRFAYIQCVLILKPWRQLLVCSMRAAAVADQATMSAQGCADQTAVLSALQEVDIEQELGLEIAHDDDEDEAEEEKHEGGQNSLAAN